MKILKFFIVFISLLCMHSLSLAQTVKKPILCIPVDDATPIVVTPAPADPAPAPACVGGPKFDPAGAKNVGNGRGIQFIGGQCLDASDCASGCCAGPCGICSGPGAQFQAGKTGCGFTSN